MIVSHDTFTMKHTKDPYSLPGSTNPYSLPGNTQKIPFLSMEEIRI